MNFNRRRYAALLRRELLLSFRHSDEWINPLLFFILIVSLFPLALGPELQRLQTIAPGIIWVAALLSILLSLDRMFKDDYEDGSLEQLLLSPHPLSLLLLYKTLAHWLTTGLPLVIIAPLLGMLLALPNDAIITLMLTLLLGSPSLNLLGGIGAALTVGLKKSGVLLSLLVLPLNVPVLIFAAGAVTATAGGFSAAGQLYYLAALLVLSLSLAPLAMAAALRISISN